MFPKRPFISDLCVRVCVCVCVCVLSCVLVLLTPWTIAHQFPLFMESRQEDWSGLSFLLQGIFPAQGSNPRLLHRRWILCRWATSYFYWLIFPSPDGFQNTYHLVSLLGETSLLSFFHESLLVTQNNRGLHNTLVYVRCIFVVILPRDYKQIPCHIHWHFFAVFAKTRYPMSK